MGEGKDGGRCSVATFRGRVSPAPPGEGLSGRPAPFSGTGKSPKPSSAAQPALGKPAGEAGGWGPAAHTGQTGPGQEGPKGTGQPELSAHACCGQVTSEGEPATVRPRAVVSSDRHHQSKSSHLATSHGKTSFLSAA